MPPQLPAVWSAEPFGRWRGAQVRLVGSISGPSVSADWPPLSARARGRSLGPGCTGGMLAVLSSTPPASMYWRKRHIALVHCTCLAAQADGSGMLQGSAAQLPEQVHSRQHRIAHLPGSEADCRQASDLARCMRCNHSTQRDLTAELLPASILRHCHACCLLGLLTICQQPSTTVHKQSHALAAACCHAPTGQPAELFSAHAGALYPEVPATILDAMIRVLADLHEGCNGTRSFGAVGAPWEFNLRDLLRWCHLAADCLPEDSRYGVLLSLWSYATGARKRQQMPRA